MDEVSPPLETKQEARKHPRSAKAIGESEEWLFTALQSIGDAVIATDATGLIVFMNLVAVRLTGWTEEEAQGVDCRTVFRIINESTREETESPVAKVIRDGVISGLANHTILIARDGTEHNIDDSGSPIRDKDDQLIGVVLIFRDITERRKSEQTRQEQQEILQTLFDHIPVIVTFLDENLQFKWVNREWIRVVSWSLEEMQDASRCAIFSPLFQSASGWNDITLAVKDGILLSLSWTTVRLSDGSSIGIGQDISERRQTEALTGQKTARIESQNRQLTQAIRETDHRVKNNLQSIIALLDMRMMSKESVVPVQDLGQIRTYINLIASLHDVLVDATPASGTTGLVSAQVALQKLQPMLQALVGEQRMQWHVADISLPIKQGLSLAVLINELVSNAVKHGGVKVELRLAVVASEVTLEVSDDGPGFPQAFDPNVSGRFGLELVESVGRLDLGGQTSYENRPSGGACVRVVFPLPSVPQYSTA